MFDQPNKFVINRKQYYKKIQLFSVVVAQYFNTAQNDDVVTIGQNMDKTNQKHPHKVELFFAPKIIR